ncbi:SseB family protein [Saccharothrix coeruleofusca]|uniref:SseB protein N-terminal domain-containing protein n=1 Tax=Saccharothrix coeruleofusca TaxID=33919 RepID=A0A918AH39_9PSEU|nr:SseB family protein [Saccharothrix coeruleofusca]GGP36469.1 hypothetical protein GCM10010185_04480 [Saccharothrix coeruleofusca]
MDVSRRALDRLCSLHKSEGVQRTPLDRHLGPELRALWGIGEADRPERARAKAALQLERALAGLDPVVAAIGRGYFNTSLEPAWWALNLTARKQRLCVELGVSARTMDRRFRDEVQPALIASLRAGPAPISPDEVSARVAAERRVVAGDPVVDTGADDRIARFRRPVSPLEEALRFLREERLHALRHAGGELVVLRPDRRSAWVPVFSSRSRLREYVRSNPRFSGLPFSTTGAKLVAELLAHRTPIGVVVNPIAERTGDLGWTFTLLPEQVAAFRH